MAFDAAVALRIINNERLRTAQGWGEFRDLGGALAVTSDAPVAGLNCIRDFAAEEPRVEYLLDVGFGLLRAFDRFPAVELTPLDRPASIAAHLERRLLRPSETRVTMVFRGDPAGIRVNPEVTVRVATADDVRTFAEIHSGGGWAKRLSLSTTMSAMLDDGNTFYLGEIDGRAAATLHLLRDGATAGIYAVATAKKQRGRGLATTLIARAVADARAAGCDVIALSTSDAGNVALYEAAGFTRAYESILWTAPEE